MRDSDSISKAAGKFSQPSCFVCGNKADNIICSVVPEAAAILDRVKQTLVYKPGQTIFYQGNEPLGLYTITAGLVRVEITSAEGNSHSLRYEGPGSALGYRSLFANEPYHATAVAVERTEICFIPKNTVMGIFQQHPAAAIKILEIVSKDLRIAEEKWTDQMDKDASQRIAESLIFLQEHFDHQNWTRREIAEWAGTTPETVIRTLAQFEREGLINQSEGRSIKITNKELLLKKTTHS